jgi:hypothetical protein
LYGLLRSLRTVPVVYRALYGIAAVSRNLWLCRIEFVEYWFQHLGAMPPTVVTVTVTEL